MLCSDLLLTNRAVCPATTPCPNDGKLYWHCLAGVAINGCALASVGPFPTSICSEQV